MKPDLLIVSNRELTHGIEHGFYPEFSQSIENGNLAVVAIDTVKRNMLSKQPVGNGTDFYVWNPYSGRYLSMWDPDILATLAYDKSVAIKTVLTWMGARDVVLKEEIADNGHTKVNLRNESGFELMNADVNVDYNKASTVNLNHSIEGHYPERPARSVQEIKTIMKKYGLENDNILNKLLDGLKTWGELRGTECYEITYLSELQAALSVAANINYKMFNDKLDFSREHNHVHTIKKKLEINFG